MRGRWLDVLFLAGCADVKIGFVLAVVVVVVVGAVVVTPSVVWFGVSVGGTPLSDCSPAMTPYAVR